MPDSDEDAVRFMTVHGSKGLEFPIVILTECGEQPRRPTIRGSRAEPFQVHCGDFATLGYERETERAMYEAEQKRLLYVATTRPATTWS